MGEPEFTPDWDKRVPPLTPRDTWDKQLGVYVAFGIMFFMFFAAVFTIAYGLGRQAGIWRTCQQLGYSFGEERAGGVIVCWTDERHEFTPGPVKK